LRLSARDDEKTSAQILRLVSRRAQTEPYDRSEKRWQVESDRRQEIVDDEKLHQQRNAAKEAYISGAGETHSPIKREPHHANGNSDDQPQRITNDGDRQRCRGADEQDRYCR